MILFSTPSSITWARDKTHKLTFYGEWTLEPKFYLNTPVIGFWDDTKPKIPLSSEELKSAIDSLLNDAKLKGWIVVYED